MQRSLLPAAVVAVALAAEPGGAASVTPFDTLVGFEAAAGSTDVTEEFAGGAITSSIFGTPAFEGAFSLNVATERLQTVTGGANTNNSQFTTLNFSAPVTGFAFTLGALGNDEVFGIEIGGAQVGSVAGIDYGNFVGVVSDVPVLSLTFRDLTIFATGTNTQLNIDDLRVDFAPIPLPPAVAFMLAGLVLLRQRRPV
jgi:hypothetical protein